MLLVIDVGNTNIKVGVYDGDKLRFISRMATDSSRLGDQYAVEIMLLLKLNNIELQQIDKAAIGSVVPPITSSLKNAVKMLFDIDAYIVSYNTAVGFKTSIINPEESGADLIMACVAGKEIYEPPCIIIDMGTATKLLVLDKQGVMLGGCIIPGMEISLNALFSNAALLTSVGLETPEKVIGNSTISCIQSGAVHGTAAMLDELCDRMEAELGYSCQVVATGGLAEKVIGSCRREIIYDDSLVLKGLKILCENSGK